MEEHEMMREYIPEPMTREKAERWEQIERKYHQMPDATLIKLSEAAGLLGITEPPRIVWLVESGSLKSTRMEDGTYRTSHAWVHEYLDLVELQARLKQEAREQAHDNIKPKPKPKKPRPEWDFAAARARIGTDHLDDPLTKAEAAPLLGKSVMVTYELMANGWRRLEYGGNWGSRSLQVARKGSRIFTSRRWLLEFIDRHIMQIQARKEEAVRRIRAKEEAILAKLNGTPIRCTLCDATIGWTPNQFRQHVYCTICGEHERAKHIANH